MYATSATSFRKPLLRATSLAAMIFALGAGTAHADSINTSPYLLGDWGGNRTKLADEGYTFNFGYGSEAAHNFSGGDQHLTRYTDQFVLGAGFDLDKIMNWRGASFSVIVTDRNGRDLGADAHIGNNQLLQEVYGRGQTWHLTDFSLTQKLFSDKLTLKVGRMNIGNDFATFSCDFQNLTFCGSQPGNIVGSYWANWPVSVWAGNAKLQTSAETYAKVGVYQVNPAYVSDGYAKTRGLRPDFPSGTTGMLIPVEFGWTPTINGYSGTYKVGAWYNTSDTADLVSDVNHQNATLTGAPSLEHNGTYGGYFNIMQQVTGHNGGDGTTVFLNVSMADKDTSATDSQVALGMEYKGIFNRPNDMVGAAIGGTHANGRYARTVALQNQLKNEVVSSPYVGDGEEYVAEVFYSWSPVPSVSLRPNLQYILHPGGTSQNSNALVLGLKSSFAF